MIRCLYALVDFNIWVSAGIAALLVPGAHLTGAIPDGRAFLLAFLLALAIYTLDHRTDAGQIAPLAAPHLQRYYQGKSSLILIAAALSGAGVVLLFSPLRVSLGALLALLAGLAHSLPILPGPGGSRQRIKDMPGAKAWFTAAVCAGGAIGAPVLFQGSWHVLQPANTAAAWLLLFIPLACNAHLFDIRDTEYDRKNDVRTLPVWLGEHRSKIFLHVLNAATAAFLCFLWQKDWAPPHPELLLWYAVMAVSIATVKPSVSRIVFSLLIDGTLFFPALALFLSKVVQGHG